MILGIYVDDPTLARLKRLSKNTGRSVEDLAESAVSEAALSAFRGSKNDPGRKA